VTLLRFLIKEYAHAFAVNFAVELYKVYCKQCWDTFYVKQKNKN